MNFDLEIFSNRLLGALLNGGYQGIVLTVVICLSLKLIPRANAATRHIVWLVTMLLVAALPAFHFLSSRDNGGGSAEQQDSTGTNSFRNPESSPESRAETFIDFDSQREAEDIGNSEEVIPVASKNRVRSITEQNDIDIENRVEAAISKRIVSRPFNAIGSRRRIHESVSISESAGFDSAKVENTQTTDRNAGSVRDSELSLLDAFSLPVIPLNWRLELPNRIGAVLIVIWMALAAVRIGILALQCLELSHLKKTSSAAPEGLRDTFSMLTNEMRIKRRTALKLCDENSAPVAVGFWRPAVLLPSRMFTGAGVVELEQVLRHELAHIARGDDWTNLLQQTIRAVLFFHPALWWLSERLTVEREIACDDHVLAAMRTPKTYALFLTEFGSRTQCRDWTAAPAAWSNKTQLSERINMILDTNRNASPSPARVRVGILTTAAALMALASLLAGPRLILADPDLGDVKPSGDDNQNSIAASPAVDVQTNQYREATLAHEAGATLTRRPDIRIAQQHSTTESRVEAPDVRVKVLVSPQEIDSLTPPAFPESGPKRKLLPAPGPQSPHSSAPIATVPPSRPLALGASRADGASVALIAEVPQTYPVPAPRAVPALETPPLEPQSPKRRMSGESSIERRLERLERMVESLLAHNKENEERTDPNGHFSFDLEGHDMDLEHEKFFLHSESLPKLADELAETIPSQEEFERIHQQARRAVDRALREGQLSVREKRREIEEQRSEAEGRRVKANVLRSRSEDAFIRERQVLESARETLAKQMEELQRQIQHLDQERQKAGRGRAEHDGNATESNSDDAPSKSKNSRDESRPKSK